MNKAKIQDPLFKNVTRYTTEAERANIEKVELNPQDLDAFMEKLRLGLVQASEGHKHAVQDNMALRVEASIKLSRPVYNKKKDSVEEFSGKSEVVGELRATKKLKKPKN